MRTNTVEKFWANVRKTGGCWDWTGRLHRAGYGLFGWNGVDVLTNRLAWMLTRGPIPRGLCVLHRCDRRPCVNPAHLFLGTRADNMADMTAKGRQAFGEKHSQSKLTAKQVAEARRLYRAGVRQSSLARRFGVSQPNISRVVTRNTWQHVTGEIGS